MPSPHDELCLLFGSPVPTQTMLGSEGAMQMSPIDVDPCSSKIGSKVVPAFVVFHTPPVAAPTYNVDGLPSTTAKSSIRPPMIAGPIERHCRFLSATSSGLSLPFCAKTIPVETKTTTSMKTAERLMLLAKACVRMSMIFIATSLLIHW